MDKKKEKKSERDSEVHVKWSEGELVLVIWLVDKHLCLSQTTWVNLNPKPIRDKVCRSITLHFPMKTTSHMILLWEIERSQTPLIKRSLHQFTSFSSPPSPTPLQNTYILSLVDPTPLSSSPKLSVNINYWPTSVNLWLIHAHPVMAPSKGSKLLLAKEFPSFTVPCVHSYEHTNLPFLT